MCPEHPAQPEIYTTRRQPIYSHFVASTELQNLYMHFTLHVTLLPGSFHALLNILQYAFGAIMIWNQEN